jgi:hypothetical protein
MSSYSSILEVVAAFLTALATIGLAYLTRKTVKAAETDRREREEERASALLPALVVPSLELEPAKLNAIPPTIKATTVNLGGAAAFDVRGRADVPMLSGERQAFAGIPYDTVVHLPAGGGMDMRFPIRELRPPSPPINHMEYRLNAGDRVKVTVHCRSVLGTELQTESSFEWRGSSFLPVPGSPGSPRVVHRPEKARGVVT